MKSKAKESSRVFQRIEESGDCMCELWVWSATMESIDGMWVQGGEHCLTLLYGC